LTKPRFEAEKKKKNIFLRFENQKEQIYNKKKSKTANRLPTKGNRKKSNTPTDIFIEIKKYKISRTPFFHFKYIFLKKNIKNLLQYEKKTWASFVTNTIKKFQNEKKKPTIKKLLSTAFAAAAALFFVAFI